MRIGIPKETNAGETRVAATPQTVAQLLKLGYEVTVEAGAGQHSALADAAFADSGAEISIAEDVWSADIVIKVNEPHDDELALLRDGATLIALLSPRLNQDLVDKLATRKITALSMDAVPRISRAQALDVLSSMANIAGYRAVVEAAHEFGRFFTGQVTAAGKVPPAKVFVAGAGVAGLAAIGAANALGAIVRANDVRPEVAEQVESMGAEFVHVDDPGAQVSSDGYAKEMGEEYQRRQAAMYAEQCKDVDIIVTTALIPGRPAPRLITAEMIATMKSGSVIVDMAAATGGNVEGTVAGEKIVTDNGVTLIGYTDLAGRLPTQASQLYGQNMVNFLKLATPDKDGQLRLDMDDIVMRGMTVVKDGELMWPPPPVQVSAAPPPTQPTPEVPAPQPPKKTSPATKAAVLTGIGALSLLLFAFSPEPFLGHFMVFMLSVVIGYYVIGNVHHALHTPLMSVTNAISGIIIVGVLLQIGRDNSPVFVDVLAFIGVLLASINIFGGFTVTQRMLGMFRKD
ncbi:NAD(P) transhydrogenase subunit alpha [Austwickia chelonae]|uniref:NAD(P) transhydrogenase subunit alpha n=1 Tax=Austwickia chelonae NBRC 105200 TaxID=1184607 RepID=K6V792_9MICO|nr:Re/Si-specific NAD(P)(+) transhydrogenase subunit alpha [Austwickia chelonae]GAB78078.1 pyridine nucleotide transhydrogenase alpha subunit [Austwickia chelonae NBRC 105200]SEV95888.1 NAD(P) transhydrogenase subunit alpha [Austwickia chelonae]